MPVEVVTLASFAHSVTMKLKTLLHGVAVAFYTLLWIGGIGSYVLMGGPPSGSAWAAPAFLVVAAVLVLLNAPAGWRRFLLFAGASGFGAEVLGVAFGFPFGGYHYTEALGPRWLGVPLVMLAAWMVLAAYVGSFGQRWWISALWLTATDFVIDPLAAGPLAFWRWEKSGAFYGIPWTNFAGWLVVSALIFLAAQRPQALSPVVSRLRFLGASVILFFVLIAFGLRMWAVGGIGLALLIIQVSVSLQEKRRSLEKNDPAFPATPVLRRGAQPAHLD